MNYVIIIGMLDILLKFGKELSTLLPIFKIEYFIFNQKYIKSVLQVLDRN